MIDGYLFFATLQLRTPLKALAQHGAWLQRVPSNDLSPEGWEGVWMPALEGQRSIYGTMSSDVGQIPSDGGDYLKFLLAARSAVESGASIGARINALKSELRKSEWQGFIRKLGGRQAIVDQLFPKFIDTIPGLPLNARELMWKARLITPAKIAAAPDDALLSIKGVGTAKLAAIRRSCASAQDMDAERVDMVTR